eukprot:Protomagalhaensia_wolfi_Nauph_80__5310@NODE_574_length_2270_cov_948_735545_g429_i0_p1_GENE_NODE_574_length_2270_cov_948_735545_g429_i0NODE_574_length_2270_cov_948_735545_g429_i0_p1_ORF_typecomplete_len172_score25_37LppX_LprAFG/PF07161_13/0_073Tet_res_leader/PF08050_12/1_6e03Tet_res_leader/PF08050_12/1_8e02Tet_res_leader/PF08050_12/16_NODE_574_length_2270_cov_948_735545_g429_i015032018
MKAAFLVIGALINQVSGLLFSHGECRCEGRWVLGKSFDASKASAFLPGPLALNKELVMDVWHSENNDPSAVRVTMKLSDSVSITAEVRAVGRNFCDKKVLLSKGSVSFRWYMNMERPIDDSVLNRIGVWQCEGNTLILGGREEGSIVFHRMNRIPLEPEVVSSEDEKVVNA